MIPLISKQMIFPSLRWEGIKGRGITLSQTLSHQGRGLFRYPLKRGRELMKNINHKVLLLIKFNGHGIYLPYYH